ncbi:ABC transporter substrate-binding protein [Hydrocarboniphaga sp.]|uniref:ABC transporter substrate-binding protein n=1 Tax=Hydrocarboniphaga sp. TaxID=2033016 RepID=UPI003D0EFE1A
MSRFFAVLGLAMVPAWAFAAGSTAPAAGSPAAVVDALQSALVAGLRNPQSCAARRQRLEPVVAQAFDFELIAQKLLRRHWKDMSEAQRTRFRTVIADTAVTTYASQFASTSADKATHFELGTSSSEGRVAATLLPASGDAVSFDYALRQGADGWKIVNVVAQGVSDLAVRSAQYESQITRSGVDGLLAELEQRNQQARAACGSAS